MERRTLSYFLYGTVSPIFLRAFTAKRHSLPEEEEIGKGEEKGETPNLPWEGKDEISQLQRKEMASFLQPLERESRQRKKKGEASIPSTFRGKKILETLAIIF